MPLVILKKRFSVQNLKRSLGLGTMGFHSYLQKHSLPFDSIFAVSANRKIYSTIQQKAISATERLAKKRGEYLDGVGTGRKLTPNCNRPECKLSDHSEHFSKHRALEEQRFHLQDKSR